MAEKMYEGMFVLNSSKFAADHERIAGQIVEFLEKAGGTVVAHRHWQEGKLAYPIAGQRKGVHYLAYFKLSGQGIQQIDRACQLSDFVLRHMIIQQPKTLFDAMVSTLAGEASPADESSDTSATVPDDDIGANHDDTTEDDSAVVFEAT